MKNFLVMMCVCASLCLTIQSPAWAGGGSGGSGGSNGKSAPRARFVIDNDTEDDVSLWIRPQGTALPPTVEALDALLIDVPAGRQNRRSARLLPGSYVITVFLTSEIQEAINEDLDRDLFEAGIIAQVITDFDGNNVDVTFSEDSELVFFDP